jgi:hypothetical protein
MTSAALFRAAAAALDETGVSSGRVVERAGLPPYQHLESQSMIPGIHLYRFMDHASRALGDELQAERTMTRGEPRLGERSAS